MVYVIIDYYLIVTTNYNFTIIPINILIIPINTLINFYPNMLDFKDINTLIFVYYNLFLKIKIIN